MRGPRTLWLHVFGATWGNVAIVGTNALKAGRR